MDAVPISLDELLSSAPPKQPDNSVSPADFPTISPDVQMERDKTRLAMLQNEMQSVSPDAKSSLQNEIDNTSSNLQKGTPFGAPVSRGTKIASELKKTSYQQSDAVSISFDDLFPDSPKVALPPAAQPQQPGMLSNIGNAAKSGLVDSLKDLGSASDALLKNNSEYKPSSEEFAKPLEWGDLLHPTKAIPKAVYQLSKGAPVLAGGVAGAAVGEAVAPEGLVAGPLIGGGLGAAAVDTAQSIGPLYADELKATPDDKDGAFDRALSKAGTSGAFTAAGWAAFGFAPFKNAVKDLLLQAFAVQPAIGETQNAVQNVQAGKPATEGMGASIPGAVVGTILPAAGLHAAHALVGGREAPVDTSRPTDATRPVDQVQPQSAEQPQQPLALPAPEQKPITVDQSGKAITADQAQNNAQVGLTPDVVAAQTAHPGFSQLSPIEQARIDAQTVQSGGDISNLNDVRRNNAQLVATYGENAAVRHVIESGDMGGLAQAMLDIAPKVEQVRSTLKQGQQTRDITSDVMTAIDELGRIKADGKTVQEVMAHGFPNEVSYEGQQLIDFLDKNQNNPQKIAQFMENYLQNVQDMGGIPSNVRGKAFDILAERQFAKSDAEKANAFSQKEGQEAQQKKSETQLMAEQARAESALTEIAKAKASGSGINPEHQTAMEIAFENARKLKESKNAKPSAESAEPLPTTKATVSEPVRTESTKPAAQRTERVPISAEAGNAGNPRSIRENGSASRPEVNTAVKGNAAKIVAERESQKQLSQIMVKTKAIDKVSGRRVTMTKPADQAMKEVNYHIQTMEALLECLG